MNNQIQTFYIPKNPNIKKGHIYTLYINNNNNLDLFPIFNTRNINIPTPENINSKSIIISEKDYTRLLELNNLAHQLTNKRTQDIQKFLNEETNTITELTKINNERQELVKKLTIGKEQQI